MTKYQKIKARANTAGVNTAKDFEGGMPGYWLLNKDGTGVWEDGNFATSLSELEGLLTTYIQEQK